MATTLPELLDRQLVELEGSDLHITTNTPPQIRVHGHLQRLEGADLTAAETKQLAYSVLTDAQKKRFEETLELDFSFGIKGLARFRCNMFNQRGAVGAVYRADPREDPRRSRSSACRRCWRRWPSGRAASCSSPARPAAASRRRSRR